MAARREFDVRPLLAHGIPEAEARAAADAFLFANEREPISHLRLARALGLSPEKTFLAAPALEHLVAQVNERVRKQREYVSVYEGPINTEFNVRMGYGGLPKRVNLASWLAHRREEGERKLAKEFVQKHLAKAAFHVEASDFRITDNHIFDPGDTRRAVRAARRFKRERLFGRELRRDHPVVRLFERYIAARKWYAKNRERFHPPEPRV